MIVGKDNILSFDSWPVTLALSCRYAPRTYTDGWLISPLMLISMPLMGVNPVGEHDFSFKLFVISFGLDILHLTNAAHLER